MTSAESRDESEEGRPAPAFALKSVRAIPKAAAGLAEEIRAQILGLGLRPGSQLPSEPELIAQSGLGRATVREALTAGKLLLLEIDWQGARQVRASMPAAHSIFILPPTRRSLEERLTARSTDSPEVIRRRLQDAQRDIAHWIEFDYVVINDGFEQAVTDFQAIVRERGEALRGTRPQVARLAVELLA